MTDDEIMDAWKKWENGQTVGEGYGFSQLAWQAAVEWATKRERERCAKIASDTEDRMMMGKATMNYELSSAMSFGESVAGDILREIEEPKP